MPDADLRHDAAERALDGLDAAGVDEVIRDGASLLVRRGDMVVRVMGGEDRHVAEREAALGRRLLADGVPVTPPIGDGQVIDLDDFVATAWRWCPAVRSARSADLGMLAGHLRRNTPPGGAGELDSFDPLAHILDIIDPCDGADDDSCFVRSRAEELIDPFAEATAEDPLGECVVHGDLHFGNVVVAHEGPLLTDLELGGWGGASYDTAAAVVAVRRYGAPETGLQRFLDAAGADPRTSPGFETFVAVYELWVTAWSLSVAHQQPAWADEAAKRVASLRGESDETWHLS